MADMKRAEREAKKEADKAEKITTATAKAALAGTDTLMELKMDIVMKNKSASSSMIIEKKVQIIVLSK